MILDLNSFTQESYTEAKLRQNKLKQIRILVYKSNYDNFTLPASCNVISFDNRVRELPFIRPQHLPLRRNIYLL